MRKVVSILFLLFCLVLCGQSVDFGKSARDFSTSGDEGTRAVYHSQSGVLELGTRFQNEGSRRACWDLPVSLDLNKIAGVRFRVRFLNADLASQLDFFIRMDGVWLRAAISPQTNGKWEEFVISKASFMPEGSGQFSWRHCDCIRFAAWRGSPGECAIHLAALDFIPANVSLAIIRSGFGTKVSENSRKEALRYAKNLGEVLVSGGIYPAVIDEQDVTQAILKQYRCVALPGGEFTSDNTVNQLTAYLRQGGRISGFYNLPPRLANAMQLPAGKFLKSSSLPQPITQLQTNGGATFKQNCNALLAVTASPSENLKFRAYWVDATGHKTPYPAIVQTPYGFWMTYVYLNQDPGKALPVLAAFFEDFVPGLRKAGAEQLVKLAKFALGNAGAGDHTVAKKHLARAQERQQSKDYPGVVAATSALIGALADEGLHVATTGTSSGNSKEMRGAWIRSGTGLPGENWWKTLRRLKIAQYNAIFPHFLSPHAAAWPSKTITGRLVNAKEDVVAECTAAGASLGIQVHAWVQVLSIADASETTKNAFAKAGRLQKKANSQTVPWLCPTQRENRMLMAQAVAELARKYDLAGIQLDMLRYESSNACYCEHCKAAFQRFAGHALVQWPQCTHEKEKSAWEAFRIHQITALAQELSKAIRGARPKIQVSAAVYSNLNDAKKNVGQDWVEWLQKGIVDFVSPMDYRPSVALFQGDLTRQRADAGQFANRIRPGIGLTVNNLSKEELQRQIQAVRAAGMEGFILFELTHGSEL